MIAQIIHRLPPGKNLMVNIRQIQEKDYEELAILSTQLGYPCSEEDSRRFLEDIQQDSEHAVFVAESETGGVIGYIHVFKTKRPFIESFAELGGLVVLEDHRGKGLGKILLDRSEEWARENGCPEMRIRSNVVRERAHPFYMDQGYVVNKHQMIFIKELIS
jgi:GNAT superfamily N-acetyltransferase